jgi:hypothetical protein
MKNRQFSREKRQEAVDWLVHVNTGFYGDSRDLALESTDPHIRRQLRNRVMFARSERTRLESMPDIPFFKELTAEVEYWTEIEKKRDQGLTMLAEEDRQRELQQQKIGRQKLARDAAKASRKLPGIVAACKFFRNRGIVKLDRAVAELQKQTYKTADGHYTVFVTRDGCIVQRDNFSKLKKAPERTITTNSFRTGYWSKIL